MTNGDMMEASSICLIGGCRNTLELADVISSALFDCGYHELITPQKRYVAKIIARGGE